jgi:hypothetical protein
MTAKKESAVKKKRAANAKACQEAYKEKQAAKNKAYQEWKEEEEGKLAAYCKALAAYHKMGEGERSVQMKAYYEKETEVAGALKTIEELAKLMKADLRRHMGRHETAKESLHTWRKNHRKEMAKYWDAERPKVIRYQQPNKDTV